MAFPTYRRDLTLMRACDMRADNNTEMGFSRAEIEVVAEQFADIFRRRNQARAQAVRDTADIIQKHLQKLGDDLRGQLAQELRVWDQIGCPPSFVRVAGQNHLEKPFNRLIAWLARPDAEHWLSCAFLTKLAELVGLPEMVCDLEQGEIPKISAEVAIDGDQSGKQPDLLVKTSRAALMLENKVRAPESGDQYGPYLKLFNRWAGTDRVKCSVLCSRSDRKCPDGWDKAILHSDLARILYDIAGAEDNKPVWGKISAVICAVAFEDSFISDKVQNARLLLRRTDTQAISHQQINDLRKVLPLPLPSIPWGAN